MIAFRVNVNGKRTCVAGVGERGVLTTFVNYVSNDRQRTIDTAVSGLYTATEEHAIWKKVDLKVGDKVQVTIIETNSVDKPKKRYRPDSETAERNQKAYVRAWAKKFGWRIVVQPKKSK
jgi:hypothetical protein